MRSSHSHQTLSISSWWYRLLLPLLVLFPACRKDTHTGTGFEIPRVSLKLPVSVVDSGTYSDGGTAFVILKDADGQVITILVTQAAFPDIPPPANSLCIGGPDHDVTGVRYPLDREEADHVMASLDSATTGVSPRIGPDRRSTDLSKEERRLYLARVALVRLQTVKDLPSVSD